MTKHDGPEIAGQGLERFKNLSPEEIISLILPRGHAINGYSSVSSERVIKIVPSKDDTGDDAPLLGFGVSGIAEIALGRALATYIQRERDGLDTIQPDTYPYLTEGRESFGGHRSRFDNLVWASDITIHQEGDEIVACDNLNTYGPLIVKAPTFLGAIILLTDQAHYGSNHVKSLPNVLYIPKSTVMLEPPALET